MNDQAKIILIAEDDVDEQELITIAFDKLSQNHHLIFAENGQEAIDELLKLSNNKQFPRLIILDVNMPRKDGLNTLKEIRLSTEYLDVPIIMYSNSDSDILIDLCKKAGCTDYVVKPSLFEEVIDSLGKMLKYCA